MTLLRILVFAFFTIPWAASAQERIKPVLRMELEKTETIPGQALVLRVTLLVPTWLPEPPVFPSFEVPNVMVRLPKRAAGPTSARVEGEDWSGVTRAYRLYPMKAGAFRIPPLPVTVTYADPATRDPLTVKLLTDAVTFKGTAPEGAANLDPFIAAKTLKLTQIIEGTPGGLKPGDVFTQTVTVQIKGTSPLFIPPLIPQLAVPGIAAYPKEPVVSEILERGVISGSRVETVTYVAEAGAQVQVAPIRLRWFDLDKKKVATAEVEGFAILAEGPPPAAPSQDIDWRSLAFWTTGVAICLLALSLMARRMWPRFSTWRKQRRDTYLSSEAYAYAEAKKALHKHDLSGALSALALWSSRLPAGVSLEEEQLTMMLTRLGAARYRRGETTSSAALWAETMQALETTRRRHFQKRAAARRESRLAPLNPQGAQ